jgi:ribosomal protein S18 acetylase RimI-like enzyme
MPGNEFSQDPGQSWGDYHLRPMESRDSDAYNELLALSPSGSMIAIQTVFKADPYEVLMQRQVEQVVVVAETSEGKVVGSAIADARPIWFEGQPVQSVHLFAIQVHPDYRGRGIGTSLTKWRIAWARQHYGEDVLIFAEVDLDNLATFRNASKWATAFAQQRESGFMRVLSQPPKPIDGLTVRDATEEDYPQIVNELNRFNQDINFTRYVTVDRLRRNMEPLYGKVFRHRFVVMENGEMVGGAVLTDPDPALETRFIQASQLTKWFARLSGMIHANGVIHGGEIDGIWYKLGHAYAPHYLIDTLLYRAAETTHALIVKVANPKAWKALSITHWQPYMIQSVAYIRPNHLEPYQPNAPIQNTVESVG